MNKKKISIIILTVLITNFSPITLKAFADDLLDNQTSIVEANTNNQQATISEFSLYNSKNIAAYNEVFKVDNSNIASISNNGGKYSSSTIDKAIDGNLSTHWETGKPNSSTFTNEVVITLNEITNLNRIVYEARQDSAKGKGFAQELEIYTSLTSDGNDFNLVTTGKYSGSTGDLVEIKFNPTEFKRIKFKFIKANQDWASAGEFMLYKQDILSEKMERLFTNSLMNEVSEEFNTIEKLNALEEEVKIHPLEDSFKESIDLAKAIIQGEEVTIKEIVAEQHGNMENHASQNLKFGFGNNNQPTGIYAKPGETITVYVDADPNKPLPKLMFSQQEGSYSSWGRTVSLKVGKNVITVPEVPKNSAYTHNVTKGGPIYIINPYTSEEQPKAPVLRFASGHNFPFLTKNTNVEEFKNFLIEYKKLIDEDVAKHPNVLDREVIDTFEFVSDHILWTGTATGAYKAYIQQGVDPLATIESYNTHMEELFKYYGLDRSNINNDPMYIRENIRLAQPFGYMYAYTGHIGVQNDVMASLLVPFEQSGPAWGLTHEIGHKMDVNARLFGEVTNNMLPMHMSGYYNDLDNRIPYESNVYKNVISENSNQYTKGGYFENLAVYWQLEMYKPGYWGQLNKLYRERNVNLGSTNPTNVKMQYLVKFSSELIGEDLSEYFARHGFEVNDETIQETSKYPKPTKKIWYLNNSKYNYQGNGFTQDSKLNVKLTEVSNGIKLAFDVADEVKADLLGYEIIKDGTVIGFTATGSFVDTSADKTSNSVYKVVPYDLNLGTGESFIVNSLAPNIQVQQDKLTLKLREDFNPMDYVKGLSHGGNNITSNVEVVENNVDTNNVGLYKVKYTLNDGGILAEKVVEVEVISNYDYLSDEEWETVSTQYGTPRRNFSIKGRINGETKEFEKGFGIHANGKITYDLSDKEYDNFEALVGVDQGIAVQNNSSIVFKIIGDGVTLATTNIIKFTDNMAYVDVPVKGVKELFIEVNDSGNGNSSDHGIIANPKLTTSNSKPKLTIPNPVSTKVGETIDLDQSYSAIDAEDGDITSKVVVSGKVNFNKVGKYKIKYSVTDSDGNEVTKTRSVAVVNMADYDYLTDYNWTSAKYSYAAPLKDKSISAKALRLTDENGKEVSFERGLGAHSISTITYDLSDKDYAYFTSYVGVDRQMYGSIGSVNFEVYVDGEKKFDSGLMNSKDKMKYVEVNINGAKELKLVVTDGNNGNGSDHATWGDTKLYFVNDVQVNYAELEALVEHANSYKVEIYTEESFKLLEEVLDKANGILSDRVGTQEEVDNMTAQLKESISDLANKVNLDDIVYIDDKYLKAEIKEALNLSKDDITIGDINKLINLSIADSRISSLEGLQYAKNLENLDISGNEIKDLSPLKNLENLTKLNAHPQIITEGMLKAKNNKITLDYKILNRDGERLKPKDIIIKSNKSYDRINLSLEELIDENGVISFDISNFNDSLYSIYLLYEDDKDSYLTQSLYMFAKEKIENNLEVNYLKVESVVEALNKDNDMLLDKENTQEEEDNK